MRAHIFIMHERLESRYYLDYAQASEVMPNSTAETTTRTATQTRFEAFGETLSASFMRFFTLVHRELRQDI